MMSKVVAKIDCLLKDSLVKVIEPTIEVERRIPEL